MLKRRGIVSGLLGSIVLALAWGGLAQPASAQDVEVEVVAPGVISTEGNETFPAQDPSDGSLWFSTYERSFAGQTIMVARINGRSWTTPEVASFSGTWGDRAPRFSPNGSRLYFTSNRPRSGQGEPGDMNIWVVEREGSGWGDPSLVPEPVNSQAADIHNVVAADGTIYLASAREGGLGRSDIYRIAPGSTEAEHLPPPINNEFSQPDLLVAPDGSWMILAQTDHPEGLGGDDLYLSRLEDGQWSTPQNLGEPVNSAEYEYGPTLSRDGRFLFFTSHRSGNADVYRVSLEALGLRD